MSELEEWFLLLAHYEGTVRLEAFVNLAFWFDCYHDGDPAKYGHTGRLSEQPPERRGPRCAARLATEFSTVARSAFLPSQVARPQLLAE